jgi:hypothetical protein
MGMSRRIAKQIDLGRLAQTEHPRIVVDLDAAGLSRLRKKFGVGATYQQGDAGLHELPARLGAEKSDRPSASRWSSGMADLPSKALPSRSATAMTCSLGPSANQHSNFLCR